MQALAVPLLVLLSVATGCTYTPQYVTRVETLTHATDTSAASTILLTLHGGIKPHAANRVTPFMACVYTALSGDFFYGEKVPNPFLYVYLKVKQVQINKGISSFRGFCPLDLPCVLV